jgi:LysR family glycine cleavage system transcriptional activator
MRAFESAARLGGFKQAANELNVTPGAIAQHIKLLEAWCGGPLFERHAKGVSLTILGARALVDFERAFDAISFASQRLRAMATPKNVSIAALPSVAQLLIASWLPIMRDAVDGVQISVTAMEEAPNLAREPYDLSLFFEANPDQSLSGPDALVPVAAPQVAKEITSDDALLAFPHISDQSWAQDWLHWFRAVFPEKIYTGNGPSYSLFSVAVEEAKNGAGILMAHRSLVAPLLKRGELVVVRDDLVEIDLALVLTRNPVSGRSAVVDKLVHVIGELV